MPLFRFELRKLLLNKKTLILLACLLALYSAVGLTSTMFLIGSGDSYRAYEKLAVDWEGPLDEEKAAQAEKIYQEVAARYGTDERAIARSIKDQPEAILAVNYHGYVERLKDGGDIQPNFANILLWENLFNNWGTHMMQFLVFVPLAFVIAPVFAIERTSGMDDLILSARHGRKKIVTAKLLSVLAASAAVVVLYLTATFAFGFLSHHSFHGWNAAIQSIPAYAKSPYGFKVWHLAVVGALWLLFTGLVYGLMIAFVSSKMSSQIGAAGVSLALLFVNVGLAAMGEIVVQRLGPLVDFGLANVTLMQEVFGEYKVFDFLGLRLAYPVMSMLVLTLLAAVMVLAAYRGQKK